MPRRRVLPVAVGLGCLYMTVLGVLVGIAMERIRFDAHRASVLSGLTTTERQVRARLIDLEGVRNPLVSTELPGANGRDVPAGETPLSRGISR
jgi:hypothetical protein